MRLDVRSWWWFWYRNGGKGAGLSVSGGGCVAAAIEIVDEEHVARFEASMFAVSSGHLHRAAQHDDVLAAGGRM